MTLAPEARRSPSDDWARGHCQLKQRCYASPVGCAVARCGETLGTPIRLTLSTERGRKAHLDSVKSTMPRRARAAGRARKLVGAPTSSPKAEWRRRGKLGYLKIRPSQRSASARRSRSATGGLSLRPSLTTSKAGISVIVAQPELRTHDTQSLTLPRPPRGISLTEMAVGPKAPVRARPDRLPQGLGLARIIRRSA